MACSVVIFLLFSLQAIADSPSDPNKCTGCHQSEFTNWKTSDHAKAMASATPENILGDFNNASVTHFSQNARFYREDSHYYADFSQEGKKQSYLIKYTFGHYPLQQYLVETKRGQLQVFPFAWDSRPTADGGQRWYPNYADEDIKSADRLHWQQPLQNWNGMCADCHSDGLKRNFDVSKNSFNTTWDNINVGCQSCHGAKSASHYEKPNQNMPAKGKPRTALMPNSWVLNAGKSVADWQGEKRDNSFMENCFSCHALRSPLTDGFTPNRPFLDQFYPSLLTAPLYHADGQIKDEVYVYGSFTQSKMYQAGVNCLDCHDKHTMKVKIQGNGLCLQCHNGEVYQQPSHLNHPADSEAGQCVNCHMPTNRYMGVDDRRDHSFKVPRPSLSAKYNTPNVCNTCHQDKSVDWASQKVTQLWHTADNKNALSSNELAYIELQYSLELPLDKHLSIINDTNLSEIQRASAIALLPNSTRMLNDSTAKPWITSDLPLLRLATAQIGHLLPEDERNKTYSSLINDQFKAIRIQAAQHLLYRSEHQLAGITKAVDELTTSNQVNMWRGEGGLNASMVHMGMQQLKPAIASLKQSIEVDPHFEASYVNLSDLYRSINETSAEHSTLLAGLKANPNSGLLHYTFGLALVRKQQKTNAISSFKRAKSLMPNNVQYAYVYWVALDGEQQSSKALAMLKAELTHYKNDRTLVELGLYLAQKLNDRESYMELRALLN